MSLALPKHNCVYCLVCDKQLIHSEGNNGFLNDGGFMLLSFHYGSRHDQCFGYSKRKEMRSNVTDLEKMLSCDQIEAFICDDCFESKIAKMRGYDLIDPSVKNRELRVGELKPLNLTENPE